MDNIELKNQAERYRYLYQTNQCSRAEAKAMIQPYLDLVNEKSIEIARKYNQRPKKIQFIEYVR